MVLSAHGQQFGVATSTVTLTREDCIDAVDQRGVAIGQMFRQAHAEAKRASLEAPKPRESETDEQKAERLRRTLMLTSQLSVSFRLADEESTQKKKKGAAQRARKAGQWAARTAAGRLWQLKPTGAHIDLDDDDDEYVEDVDEDYESSLRSVGSAAEPSVGAASGVAVTANDVAIRIEQSKKAGRRLSTTACACAADGGRSSAAAGASDAERFLSVPCYQYEARLVHSLRQLKPRLVGLQRMVLKAMKHEEELRTSHPKEARDAWELLSCHKAYLAELAAALLGVRIRCEAFEPAKLSADGVVDVKSVEQLLRVSWYRLVPTRGVQARVQRASQSLAAGLALCLVGHFTILAVLGWVGNCEALLADAAVELKAGASVGDPAAGGAVKVLALGGVQPVRHAAAAGALPVPAADRVWAVDEDSRPGRSNAYFQRNANSRSNNYSHVTYFEVFSRNNANTAC